MQPLGASSRAESGHGSGHPEPRPQAGGPHPTLAAPPSAPSRLPPASPTGHPLGHRGLASFFPAFPGTAFPVEHRPIPSPRPGVPDTGAPCVPGGWPQGSPVSCSPSLWRASLPVNQRRQGQSQGKAGGPSTHEAPPSAQPPPRGERAKGRGQDSLCQPSSLPWERTPWDILGAQRSLGNKFWAQDRLIRALGGLITVGGGGGGRPIRGDEQISPLPRSEFRNQPARGGVGRAGAQGTAGPRGAGETPQEAHPRGRPASRWENRPQAR